MRKIITVEHVEKAFGAGKEEQKVLNGISVEIQEGAFISVMGPSGSGKSTLLYAMSGMDNINGGKVLFDNIDLSALNEKKLADLRRTKMGFIFQQPTLLKNLNILDNIILPAMRDNRKDVAKLSEKAKALMEKMGIKGLEPRNMTQVSGGQLQRAGICRALINDPKVIFGDEPTGALNSNAAEEIMEIIAQINQEGTTVILVTHDPKIAAKTERILFISDGKLVSELQLEKFDGTELDQRLKMVTARMQGVGI